MKGKSVDLVRLKSALAEAAIVAVKRMREEEPSQHFYTFALYHNGEVQHMDLWGNTEEELAKAAEEYAAKYGTPAALNAKSLRWSIGNWTYGDRGDDFGEIRDVLESRDQGIQGNDIEVDQFEDEGRRILGVGIEVLKELDRDGIFGVGAAREAVTVLVVKGDQSDEERIRYAVALNPPKTVFRFKRELKEGFEAYTAWSKMLQKKP